MSRLTLAGIVLTALMIGTAPVGATQENGRSPQPSRAAARALAAPVNLKTASSARRQELPGIGPRTAERIIEYRQKNGGFKKIEELMNVKGIGEKSFLKLKAQITVAKPERPADQQ